MASMMGSALQRIGGTRPHDRTTPSARTRETATGRRCGLPRSGGRLRVGVVGAIAAAERLVFAVAATRTRRQMVSGLHAELVAAVRAPIGTGRDVAAGGNWISHARSATQPRPC